MRLKFRNLISKHFDKDNPPKADIYKNTLKLSYSCTRNIDSIIKAHNNKLMRKMGEEEEKRCLTAEAERKIAS